MTIAPLYFQAGILSVMGIVLLYYIKNLFSFGAWPGTLGNLLSVDVVPAKHAGTAQAGYIAVIYYEYSVEGRTYSSNNIYSLSLVSKRAMDVITSKSEAVRIGENLVNGKFSVFYDPLLPERAFLVNGPKGGFVLFIFIFFAALIASIVFHISN